MRALLAVAAGGALGALARYGVSKLIAVFVDARFPFATFLVNVVGSFLIGILFIVFESNPQSVMRPFLITGILGAFTTFSTFSLETITVLQDGRYGLAIVNVAGNVILGLGAVVFGMVLGRAMISVQ